MKASRSSSPSIRYLLAALLGGVGLFFAWKVLMPGSDGAGALSRAAASCPLPKKAYNLVQVYKGDGKLDLTMFVFENDALSKEVLAHSAYKVSRMAHGDAWRMHANLPSGAHAIC